MEICHGTLQPKKPQEVPWKCALVQYLAARPRYVCRCLRGAPREAQRGPDKPREPQRGTETHREAQRRPERPREAYIERPRGRAWIEQAYAGSICVYWPTSLREIVTDLFVTGNCHKGKLCNFAHGQKEFRAKPDLEGTQHVCYKHSCYMGCAS